MKIVSYNIHMANRIKVVISEFKKRRLMKDLAVLCLQEVAVHDLTNTCKEIAKAFPYLDLSWRLEPFCTFHGKTQANAILYRKDILQELDYETFELPRVKIHEIPFIRKFLSKGTLMDKIICQNILFQTQSGHTIRVFNTHLDAFTTWVHTFYQIRKILRKCKRQSRRVDAIYLCGDLNTVTITRNDDKYFIRLREFLKLQRFYDVTDNIQNTYQLKTDEIQSFVASPILLGYLPFLKHP